MSLTAHVQFCGAGGETLGAVAAGIEPVLAMNHWARAIETHGANFPNTEHLYADIVCLDPRAYPGADMLLTSPECRARSYAKGRPKNDLSLFGPDEAAERSRATMWDVPRFAEVHRYKAIVVENVVQTVDWCEARTNRHGWDPRRRDWKCNCGVDFRHWLKTMTELGYEHELVSFNSMFAPPTPQSRDRLYMVFWLRGVRRPNLRFDVEAWCPTCENLVDGYQAWKKAPVEGTHQVGRFGQQYVYRCTVCDEITHPVVTPAVSAIDFTLPAQRIGDRAKPLAAATQQRIRLAFPLLNAPAMVVACGGNSHERPNQVRAWPTVEPLRTITGTRDRALVVSNMANNVPRIADVQPMGTVTTGNKLYLLKLPSGLVVPVHHGGVHADSVRARSVSAPLPTQTTRQETGLVVDLRGSPTRPGGGNKPRRTSEPISTVCADGNHHGLVIRHNGPGGGRLTTPDTPGGWGRRTDEPTGTITTRDTHAIVVPYRQGRGTPATFPLPTTTTVDPYAFVSGDDIAIEDCGFRMFAPHEIQRAMVMQAHYDGREFVLFGSNRDQVKLAGNAVTPPVSYMVSDRLVEALS